MKSVNFAKSWQVGLPDMSGYGVNQACGLLPSVPSFGGRIISSTQDQQRTWDAR